MFLTHLLDMLIVLLLVTQEETDGCDPYLNLH